MSILDPSVIVENILNTALPAIVADAKLATPVIIPLILAQFPQDYINFAIAYLADPTFKPNVWFQYPYDPAILPVWNIVLSNENEAAGNQQSYLGDVMVSADTNGFDAETENAETGSLWATKVNVYIRTQKERQCIVLYNITKWIFLNNRLTFETNGIIAPIFSGSDITYEVERKPTFVFTRAIQVTGRAANTVDLDVSGDPALSEIIAAWPLQVTALPQASVEEA